MKRVVSISFVVAVFAGCTGIPHPDVGAKPPEAGTPLPLSSHQAFANESVTQVTERHRRNGIATRSLGGRAYTITDMGEAPKGDAEMVIRDLTPAALAGDGRSSYSIHLKLRECVEMLRRFDIRGAAAVDSSTYESCRSLSADNYGRASEWLDRAAEQGHLGAQLLYVADPETTLGGPAEMLMQPQQIGPYKKKARTYLESAAADGSVEALMGLGDAYWFGALTERNPAEGLAYYRAVEKVDPRYVSRASMEVLKKELTQKEIEYSRIKGMQIYDECCRSR